MIPVTPREPFVMYPYPPRYRQVWIPTSVAMPRPSQAFPRRNAPHSEYTSADELCAANVLLNLSPKERPPFKPRTFTALSQPAPRERFPPVLRPSASFPPQTIAMPTDYSQRWMGVYSEGNRCHKQRILASPSQVSDNSVEECNDSHEASESSCSEDESSFADEVSAGSTVPPVVSSQEPVSNPWSKGSVSLSLPDDTDVLSPLHCFMRRYCVEAFSATPDDVSTPRYGKSHGVKVVTGQVGIRCLYCKHRAPGKRPERAVCYPSSLRNIYHSIETWQRRHSLVCTDIPPWVRKSIIELMESSKSRAGGRRQYWEDSAKRLGMIDTTHGVRFSRPPGDLGTAQDPIIQDVVCQPVVRNEDSELITDYLFFLMQQMETCGFAEEDRTGGRSKIKNIQVGFPGMQCKHCQGKAGFGRYFPTTANALALANSDRNIFNHIQKCRRCPSHIKMRLVQLSRDQTHSKNRRGLRKMFFQRVWNRIHRPSD